MAPSHQYALQVVYTPTPFRLLSLRLCILPPIIPGERLSASAEPAGENGANIDYSPFLRMADHGNRNFSELDSFWEKGSRLDQIADRQSHPDDL
jgi:hypothetical protein